MKSGSLFSGIAGIELGLSRAGIDTAWFCEFDKDARSVLARHFPDTPIYEDVTTLDPASVEPVDILTGGFPCQDLSVAGRRKGLAGERSGLFHEFMRIADSLTPDWLLIENVPGLLSSNEGRDMGVVIGTLGELGYGWAYRVLDAQYFGVAQRRRRVFIVGCLGNPAGAAEVLFESESCDRDTPPSREPREGSAGATTGGVRSIGFQGTNGIDVMAGDEVSPPVKVGSGIGISSPPDVMVMAPAFSKRPGQQIATRRDGLSYAVTTGEPPRILAYGLDELNHTESCEVTKTLRVDDPYPGIRQGDQVRRLTPTECERLQGFPDGWTEGQADSKRYKQLGNAVCVPVAEWIGRRIAAQLRTDEP